MNKPNELPSNSIECVKSYLLSMQDYICKTVEALDGQTLFKEDNWSRKQEEGGGITRILRNGAVFASVGVNFSHIHGKQLPPSASNLRPHLADHCFHALGLSIVSHPENPYVPTAHANVRFFIAQKENSPPIWWFGGGFDLTPYYGFVEDCKHWHRMAFEACQPFGPHIYPRFKQWCDNYFYLKNRQEARGIGGLFFDDFCETDFATCFALMRSIAEHFMKGYQPIVEKRKTRSYGTREKNFQLYRRGRYVEFNLLYDRGTLFGLQSGGRTESILMSLPPEVHWEYNWNPEENSAEAELYQNFLPIKDWLNS